MDAFKVFDEDGDGEVVGAPLGPTVGDPLWVILLVTVSDSCSVQHLALLKAQLWAPRSAP